MRDTKVEVYTQEPAVNWLAPAQLLQTGIEALIAVTIGRFADAREVQGALFPSGTQPSLILPDKYETWIDYIADTGDGWHATCSMAWCLSRPTLDADGHQLPRGDILVLGGDQVYPTPADNVYRTRFVDPFRAVFPEKIIPEKDAPLLLALPGNHDWYDGLRGFSSLFCRQQAIGSWRTQQATSYFAVQLPHGWWLWGLDLQLDAEIDRPQFEYFKKQAALLGLGDKVILCTPEPSWIAEGERLQDLRKAEAKAAGPFGILGGDADSIGLQTSRFRSLRDVEALLSERDARLAAVLAGDLHHYARYAPAPDTPQPANAPPRITCGGGGAYLLGTHALPETIDFHAKNRARNTYKLEASYPSQAASGKLRNRAWALPVRNIKFTSLLALVYLLYLWVLQSASRQTLEVLGQRTLTDYLATVPLTFDNLLQPLLKLLPGSPASTLFTVAIIATLVAFTRAGAKQKCAATLGGFLHACAHLGLAMFLLWIMVHIAPCLAIKPDWPLAALLGKISPTGYSMLIGLVLGGVMGGLLFGIWLVLSNRLFGWHGEEVFSCQSITDYKSFLRMKITPQGLTIYPLKLEKVCKSWRIGDGIRLRLRAGKRFKLGTTPQSRERFVPEQEIKVELIESPIVIPNPGKA